MGERTATIVGDVAAKDLIAAVKKAGYDAAELHRLEDETEKENLELAEYRKLWKRVVVAGVIGIILFVLGMGDFLPGIRQGQVIWLLISLITFLALALVGGHFFKGAWASLRAGRGNMDTLVALGTGTAWVYSTFVIIFPDSVPEQALHAYFEAVVIIVALVSLGSALETTFSWAMAAWLKE